MRALIAAVGVMCSNIVAPQSPNNFNIFLNHPDTAESGMCVADVGLSVKISENKPATIPIYKNGSITGVDSHPRKFRYQPRMQMSILVCPRDNVLDNFQPGALVDIVGFENYLALKLGACVTFRDCKVSVGPTYGWYLRRLDINNPDWTFRSKPIEVGHSIGGYFYHDNDYYTWFAAMAKEESYAYYEIKIDFKISELVRFLPSGMAFQFSSETFLGTGVGLVYMPPSGRKVISATYCIPQSDEVTRQRYTSNFIGEGLNLSWHFMLF